MSDVRTLLKAKRQEIRVDHPSAYYTSAGQLRCVVCETNVKHPSAWDGHLGSKAHRTNAARVREEERRQKEQVEEDARRSKRKVPDEDDIDVDSDISTTAKKQKVTPVTPSSTSVLPADFFSDPSRVAAAPLDDEEDEEETGRMVAPSLKATSAGGDPSLDQEWIEFQQSVINAPDTHITYDGATIVAEPELVSDSSKGLPALGDTGTGMQPAVKTDDEERRRKEQEERELIMDRLMDEERAQEEGDMKVATMKNKLAALRKRRETARSVKNVGVV